MPADHSRFSIITDGVYENINSKILDLLIKSWKEILPSLVQD